MPKAQLTAIEKTETDFRVSVSALALRELLAAHIDISAKGKHAGRGSLRSQSAERELVGFRNAGLTIRIPVSLALGSEECILRCLIDSLEARG